MSATKYGARFCGRNYSRALSNPFNKRMISPQRLYNLFKTGQFYIVKIERQSLPFSEAKETQSQGEGFSSEDQGQGPVATTPRCSSPASFHG